MAAEQPPQFLNSLHPDDLRCGSHPSRRDAVREACTRYAPDARDLATFAREIESAPLSREERITVVKQALLILEQTYAHLPHKRAMYATDPIQRLKLFLQTLASTMSDSLSPVDEFHLELLEVFASLRDRHTRYVLPQPRSQYSAFLPFMVEECVEDGRTAYIVSHIAGGLECRSFQAGVEVLYWNGVPIRRAIQTLMRQNIGSNPDARRARATQALTNRTLKYMPLPDEEWVIVGYSPDHGPVEEIRFDWMVSTTPLEWDAPSTTIASSNLGIDREQDATQRMRQVLFRPDLSPNPAATDRGDPGGSDASGLRSRFPTVFEARRVPDSDGPFGYLRIRTFTPEPGSAKPGEFADEFVRLLNLLPPDGLILDVRGNAGGNIANAEEILQTLTPQRIVCESGQFLNSPLNLAICRRNVTKGGERDLSAWVDSMSVALMTGASLSAGFPLSNSEACNRRGQHYFGPVVLITDALSYSATDIFAAGFADHNIGTLLGVHGTTGAGGATSIHHSDLGLFLLGIDSEYHALPGGVDMTVAFQRTLRVGPHAGLPIEDFGVLPTESHHMTVPDLLHGNVDLINKAIELLCNRTRPPVRFEVVACVGDPAHCHIRIETAHVTRVDVFLADHPMGTFEVVDDLVALDVERKPGAKRALELRAFSGSELVVRYRTIID